MKRVAVITDIHGNLPALEASLQAIEQMGVDAVYCGGDLVGYGPHPNEVCHLIEERAIPAIYGNYDYAIARELTDCGCAYVTQHDRDLGQRSVAWTLANTGQRSKEFMRALPFDLRFQLGSQHVHLVHGSPRKVNEYLFEDKPALKYVLFVCTHNAGRSQMAQGLFDRECKTDACRAESAGSQPARHVYPEVVEVMRELGIDLSGRRPKRLTVRCSCTPTGR